MAFNQANQAYAEYNRNKVLTASPAELTLLLYEGAIKFCNIAIIGLEQNDMEKVQTSNPKIYAGGDLIGGKGTVAWAARNGRDVAENIIEEFQATLNHKYPVAEDFDKIYKYIYNLLVEANIKKDKELLEQALTELRGMRDTWKEVMVKAKQG